MISYIEENVNNLQQKKCIVFPMHERVVFNFGEFKSRKCLISFSRDYVRKGQKNKKALKNQGFSWLYLFYSPYLVAEVGMTCPLENIVASVAYAWRTPDAPYFLPCRLASSRTASARAPSPLPPPGYEEMFLPIIKYHIIPQRNEKL